MLSSFIKKLDLDDSVILVKGSRGMKMEEFLSEIKIKSLR
jgi:UDP-N-acetylmuramyl pentapeptide synthase